ncbi:MAG: hypothetical protein ACRDQA_02790, partial [Nocardioidaceae bacterium]
VVPLVAGWPLLGWRALHHDSPGVVDLAVHPALWVVAVVSAALVLWAALAMLLDPPRSFDLTGQGWEIPWQVLAVVVAGVLIAVMLVGFAPDLQAVWLRPIVLVVSAAGVIGLALTTLLVPLLSARVGYVAILVVSVCAPTCVYLLLTTADVAGGEVSAPVVLVLTAAALAGSGVGWRRPMVSVELGLLVLAASAAGGWVMPSHGWWMAAAVAPFMLGSGACLVGGVRLSLTSPMTLRFAAAALVGAVLLGLLGAAPVSWALAGDAPVGAGGARAGGRAILGLTFAASVLGAAYVSVLASRLRSRSTPSGQKALEPSEQVG